MPQGMTLEQHILELIVNQLSRRVVITLNLIADNLYLLINLVLGIGAVKHHIGKQRDGFGYMLLLDGCIKRGILLIGKGIQVATQLLQTIDNLDGVAMLGALKRQMLAEVSHTLLARQLIACAGSYLVTAVNHLGHRGLVDNAQTVCKGISIVGSHINLRIQ